MNYYTYYNNSNRPLVLNHQINPVNYTPIAYLNYNNNYLNTYNNSNNTMILKSPFTNDNFFLTNNNIIKHPTSSNTKSNSINNINSLTNRVNHLNYNPNNLNLIGNRTLPTVANVKKLPQTQNNNNIAYNNNNLNLNKNNKNNITNNLPLKNQINPGNNLNRNNIVSNQPKNNTKKFINIDPNIDTDADNLYRINKAQNNNKINTAHNNKNNAAAQKVLTNPNKNISNNEMIPVVENNLNPNSNMNKMNKMNNMNNMNNISNQKAVEEINLGGPKNNVKNIRNNPNENKYATVKKISDTTSNATSNTTSNITSNATSEKVKKRILNRNDYINIIYKEVGIINLGNTCFINSCLQVLIHCPLFIYSFFNKYKLINKENTPISYAFYELCKDMMEILDQQQNKYIDISNFKNEFGSKHSIFGGYLQNDSQEFFRVLLEDISTELNEAINKGIYRTLTNSDTTKTKQMRDIEFDKNFSEREKSIITDLFYAQLITTFTCQCTHNTYSFQKILDFPLLLPENKSKVDINDLLIKYFQPEEIDFERKCEKCQKKIKHRKETKISRPPKLLILSFQRIDSVSQKKNECVVTFPKILKINEFIEKGIGNDNNPTYELFAVINHQGTVDFGHYFSYIKFHRKEDWYEFNDSQVKPIGKNIESFPYAYALFYAKL